ncbi:alpha/beta hydrolase [Aspergillus affinis]|uniref:alpha/beta hydrolase n=1 Tax=Aspergillus affinis TaxID=1070780 RepID=UPI0022FF2CD9|nr:uncharacterized protein KD926_005078 [Aspergillus affinis]KAI9042748.1 hypothetical protein KD926_005078 [Aspergillus affinis]
MTTHDGIEFGQKFANFNVIQSSYKRVGNHDIGVDMIIPRTVSTGKRPLIARFHGGGLVTGDSLYEAWFPKWLLELAESTSAVIISANYRFFPEVVGLDILDDVEDFWTWLHSNYPKDLLAAHSTPIEPDLDRILTAGDSAGGLLAVYLTLSHPDEIRAGTAAYPSIHWDKEPLHPQTWNKNLPDLPVSVYDEYLLNMNVENIESSDRSLTRTPIAATMSRHRKGYETWIRGSDESSQSDRLFQLARLDKPDARLPRGGLVIFHGVNDESVPHQASERFVEKARDVLKNKQGGDKVVLALRPGPHGFEADAPLKEEWIDEALREAVKVWLE